MDLIQRPRRLRGSETLRKMVRETRIDKSSLIYPLFVREGHNIKEEIPSMEGQFRYSVDQLPYELENLSKAGVSSVMLFGIPDHKDEVGSGAYAPDGIVQKALREAKKQFPDMYYITDVCMCEYTSHGHCGVLCGHEVENDATLELLAKTALSHVEAGADMVAPRVWAGVCVLSGNVWIRQVIRKLRSCPMQLNMHLPFMVLSVTRQVLLRHSATVRAIRWITITEGKA